MLKSIKGKVFPYAPTGLSPHLFPLPYGPRGVVAGGGLPIQFVYVVFDFSANGWIWLMKGDKSKVKF
jgi:hypothetical protein